LIKEGDYAICQLLDFDNLALEKLFPSRTTIDKERYEELMLYFKGSQQGQEPTRIYLSVPLPRECAAGQQQN
jgi:hypothetical protein